MFNGTMRTSEMGPQSCAAAGSRRADELYLCRLGRQFLRRPRHIFTVGVVQPTSGWCHPEQREGSAFVRNATETTDSSGQKTALRMTPPAVMVLYSNSENGLTTPGDPHIVQSRFLGIQWVFTALKQSVLYYEIVTSQYR